MTWSPHPLPPSALTSRAAFTPFDAQQLRPPRRLCDTAAAAVAAAAATRDTDVAERRPRRLPPTSGGVRGRDCRRIGRPPVPHRRSLHYRCRNALSGDAANVQGQPQRLRRRPPTFGAGHSGYRCTPWQRGWRPLRVREVSAAAVMITPPPPCSQQRRQPLQKPLIAPLPHRYGTCDAQSTFSSLPRPSARTAPGRHELRR